MFFSKQYIKCSFGKEREAEVCKQTEIVIAPIRLNRKPSQLGVYSEPGCRGQGLLREHFLDSEQTDVRRQVTVEVNKNASSLHVARASAKIYKQMMSNGNITQGLLISAATGSQT